MKSSLRLITLCALLLLCLAGPAAAQYLKIRTDNPSDNTRLRATGTTILTITLDTNHDRNGALQSCNSHTSANGCGSVTTVAPLDMFSYTLALKATGGLVVWGTFTPSDAAYTDAAPLIFNNTEIEINKARPTGTISAPGLNSIGTIPVTPLTGSPSIGLQVGPGALNPFGFGTGFGTDCDGFFFPNTYTVGDPADPCGNTNGVAGDWFDWDGANASCLGCQTQPSITAPATATGAEGSPISISATATDPDAGQTLTITATGLPPAIPFGGVSGPSPLTATIRGTPGFTDAGIYNIVWTVNDGSGSANAINTTTTVLTVANTNRPPVLNAIGDMSVPDGATANQAISGADPDGDALTFSKVAGPSFMTVTTTTATTGNIHLATGFADAGTYSATVRASDGTLSDSKSFNITAGVSNRAPVLNPIANMSVNVGGGCGGPATADQAISGSDPDGDALTFSKVSGPTYMTVTTTSPTTGNIHLAPGGSDTSSSATVQASDGTLTNSKSFFITIAIVNQGPVLAQPANMTVNRGATADQTLTASDACGNPLTFATVSGPTFMTVTTTNPGTGTATGNIHLAPGLLEAVGTYGATVQTSDGTLTNVKSLTITVQAGADHPPVLNPIANMSVAQGCTGFATNQAISGSDPDGDALTFSKVTGPTFMTVSTTSPTTGNIHLAPGVTEPVGTSSATVRASDGTLNADRTMTITVLGSDIPPALAQPANMTVNEGATADQTLSASDPCGDVLTFFKASGPTFATVTTTSSGSGTGTGNIHLAPGIADVGTFLLTVQVSDGSLVDQKNMTVTVVTPGNRPPVLNTLSNMALGGCVASTADQAISASDPDGDAITFTSSGPSFMTLTSNPQVGNTRTGNIHLAPPLGTSGTFAASVTATANGESDTKFFAITMSASDCPPTLNQPANMTVNEGATADQTITATDPDGNPLAFSKDSGPLFVFVTTTTPGAGTATGNIHLAPGFSDFGTYSAIVRVSDGSLTDAKSFTITVNQGLNRCPVANPGGPYSGLAGVPVSFNGTASSDPDGNPLTYAWDFDASDGIGVDAVGAMASYAYPAAGTFTVTLTVTDNASPPCSNTATTTASIAAACDATVFNGYDTIRLGSGKPFWFAYVQPATGCYANTDVITSSFVLKYAGRQIPAEATKTSIGGDKSGDGIQEIKVSWSKDNLRALFTGTGLSNGHNTVTVTIEANLVSGGKLSGTTQLDVVNNGNFTAATVAPNPLNPEATLTFTTSRQGAVRIDLFNIQGRLVRRLVDESALTAGTHDVKIDGRGSRGEKLPSGVYYIRGTSSEGVFKKLVTILK